MAMGSSAKKTLHRCVKSVIQACRQVLDFYRSFDCQRGDFQYYDGAIANPFFVIPVNHSFREAERTRTRDEEQRFQGGARSNSFKVAKGRVMPMGGRDELLRISEE